MSTKRAAKVLGLLAGAGLLVASAPAATSTASPPVPIKVSTRNEGTPAAGGAYFSWSKSRRGHPHVYDVYAQQEGQPAFKVNAAKTTGWSGGIDGTRLAYQQVKKGNSDIRLFDLVTRRRTNLPPGVNTKRWEWKPTISGDWLLYGRGVIFGASTQTIMLFNLVTREQRVLDSLRSREGLTQAGQVNGNYAVWMKCMASDCNIYRYDITAATTTQMPGTGQVLYGPSVTSTGTTYYGRSSNTCGQDAELVKTTLDGSTFVLYSFPQGFDFGLTYAAEVVNVPPGPITTTRIYYDRANCSTSRTDIYRIDDEERLPPVRP